MARLVSELVQAVKERAAVPENNDRFVDSDYTEMLKEELDETVIPFMTSLVEEFFVVNQIVELQDDDDNDRFPALIIPIPKRAYARGIRDVQFLDTGSNRFNIPSISPEDKDLFTNQNSSNFSAPYGYYFQNDAIRLLGANATVEGSLEFSFYVRPPTLVDDDNYYAPVSNISYSSGTTTFTMDISNITASTFPTGGAAIYDLFNKSTGAYVAIDLVGTVAGVGAAATFTTTTPIENEVTLYKNTQTAGFPVAAPYESELVLVPQEENGFSPIPVEVDNLLVLAVASRILEAIGDTEGLGVTVGMIKKTQEKLANVYSKRNQGENHKIVNRRGIYSYMRTRFYK